MSEELHFYSCSPAVWRKVQAAAQAEGALAAEWAGRAVKARLDQLVGVDRWALLHLVLSVGLLPPPAHPHERADLERCLAECVRALS